MANKNTIKVDGKKIDVGNKLGAGEIKKIAKQTGKSVAQIENKASNQGVKVSSAAQNVVQRATAAPAQQPLPTPVSYSPGPSTASSSSSSSSGGGGGGFEPFDVTALPSNFINEPIYNAAQDAANLQMQRQIEELRQAGQTERQKLINENNLAVTGAEVKGKLDLQGIINSGYKNIANIERGSNMFSSIMGAFNF